jgi:CO/xanthine dehydrogenase Mo-binding subunit
MMPKHSTIGKGITRVDAVDKVTGQAVYGDDLVFQNLLYAKALRSPCAHAKILNIDVSKAQRLAGVKAIATGKDLPVLGGEALKDYPFLALDKVRYIGEPVVAVAATDEALAEEAIDLIKVEYEEMPAVLDPLKSMEPGAPLIHENLHLYQHIPVIKPVEHSNICHHIQFVNGDVAKGFEESAQIFEDTFTTQMIHHVAIEPHMAIAQVDLSGRLTVWVTNDGPHRLRNDLAAALGIPMSKIRVISPPYMGGSFGGKGGLKVETICIPLALKTGGHPVKMVLTREEVFTASTVRHPSVVRVKTGVKNDGTLWAREVKIVYDTGAYAEKGPTVCEQASTGAIGPYRVPNVKVDGYCVYTNKIIPGAYRGYGIPQVCWAYESQMDIIAARLGMDGAEIRLKNAVEEGDISPTGQQVLHSVGVKECIQKVIQTIEWDNKPDRKNRGKGIACGYKNTKTPSGSSAIVKVSQDGSIEVLTSSVEFGQGPKTILSQVAAETLGAPVESVTVSTPDTDMTPFDASTTSSRTTFHMGNAVKKAAEEARARLLEMAAETLGVEVKDLRTEKGKIFAVNHPEKKLSFAEVIKSRYGAGLDIIGSGSYYPVMEGQTGGIWSAPSIFWMYGAHGADVEVDVETGKVKVLKIVGAHDMGKAINPITCEGQIEGGMVHGMGPALFEEMLVSEKGEILNPSFADYKVPTALDVPEVTPLLVEVPHKDGPWGAKGIGEMTTVPIAAAIANAIYHAVGVRIKSLPITPEKLLRALKEKGGAKENV